MTIGAIGAYRTNFYYGSYGNYNSIGNSGAIGNSGIIANSKDDEDAASKIGKTSSPQECETCKNRKYVDGSDEANVSFKTAAHVSPEAASSAVRSHEGEHVSNAYNKAAKNNGEVVSANVAIHTAVCPECGRTYVSGGTTTTQIKYSDESNPYQKNFKSADAAKYIGTNLDYIA